MSRSRTKYTNKVEKRKIQTNPRRLLFLLKYSINQLPLNQLPSIGNFLRYIQFIKSLRSLKFKSNKAIVACFQTFPGKDLICKGGLCRNPNHRCVIALVMDVWKKAGFGEFILSGAAVRLVMWKNRISSENAQVSTKLIFFKRT
nr:uncharacterized protein LOC124816441 isoform X2 [Hydra vulgaris]